MDESRAAQPHTPELHPDLVAFFDAHRGKTREHRDRCSAHVVQTYDASHDVLAHLHELKTRLRRAELSAQASPSHVDKIKWMHTRLDAAIGAMVAAQEAFAVANDKLMELERGFEPAEIQLNTLLSSMGVP